MLLFAVTDVMAYSYKVTF